MEPLTFVHSGSFSGSAWALRGHLRDTTDVVDVDLMPMTRQPSLVPSRVGAVVEARRCGRDVPWAKTASWSRATQRSVEARGVLTDRRVLFVQTIAAFVLPASVEYAVYTDRVGREGAAKGGRFASRFTPQWLERETAFLLGARRVFVMGPSTAGVLTDVYGLAPDRVSVVGAGPNAALTGPRTSQQCRRILFVGTTWEQKGGPELVEAFTALRREVPDLELVVTGSRPRAATLPPGVRVVGWVPHGRMDELYSEADLLVIPSHQEAYGIALLEGFLKGLPCVTTSVGNQHTIVGSAGICIQPGDVGALTDAIRNVIDEYPSFQRRAVDRGQVLRRTVNWERVATAILAGFDTTGPNPVR